MNHLEPARVIPVRAICFFNKLINFMPTHVSSFLNSYFVFLFSRFRPETAILQMLLWSVRVCCLHKAM